MNIEYKKLKTLTPYEKNTKKHDKTQIANVAESINQYGFVQPIVVDKNDVIVIGHCRYEAAKKLKLETVPCVCVDDLTDEQVKALRIVDNKTNESPWDMDFLADELAKVDLSTFDFDFGVSLDEDDTQTKEREEISLNESISVVVECSDDEEAETIFEKLSEEGYKCHISTL